MKHGGISQSHGEWLFEKIIEAAKRKAVVVLLLNGGFSYVVVSDGTLPSEFKCDNNKCPHGHRAVRRSLSHPDLSHHVYFYKEVK